MRPTSSLETATPIARQAATLDGEAARDLELAVNYVLDDCFFTVGQVVGSRKTLDYEAVIWLRDHYRARFTAAMMRFGNRWRSDRSVVTAVAMLLAERAVRYAGTSPSIDLEAAKRAANDAERCCELECRRQARALRSDDGGPLPLRAGVWCVPPDGPDTDED